ncbi:MAG: DUF4124 domain-containing protein [Rhodanobacteraceae bacterium]|jgi:hypothetical protein|nr:DUF4124 domain-containing protein [Rhodanobacteraceae bacterium]
MRRLRCLLATVLAAGVGASASAAAPGAADHNRYKWRDADGNLHYGDSLPPEAARLGYEIIGPTGLIVRRVERARTSDELAAAKAAAAKAQAERSEADSRARIDTQLLAGYPEEADLQRAQQQQLELLEQKVTAAQISLRSQEQNLADLLGRAADVERGGKELPPALAKELKMLRKQVDDQRLVVARRQDERAQALERFAGETARYRELKAQRGAPSRTP